LAFVIYLGKISRIGYNRARFIEHLLKTNFERRVMDRF
jgi:hypothetical protein